MDNYFKIFDLDITYDIDLELLEEKYFQLLKKYHPDNNIGKTEQKKLSCLTKSMLINHAYQTLSDSTLRIFHMLKLKNIDLDSETNIISNDFLSEIFEYRASISELSISNIDDFKNDITKRINISVQEFKNTYKKNSDLAVNEAIKIKYYNKILEEVRDRKL